MATISEFSVSKALLDNLLATPNLPEVAINNSEYDPTIGIPYIREMDMPANTQAPTLNSKGYQRRDGAYRIWVLHPKNTGKFALLANVDKVVNGFPRGLKLNHDGQSLEITRSDVGEMFEYGEWVVREIMIRYTVISP